MTKHCCKFPLLPPSQGFQTKTSNFAGTWTVIAESYVTDGSTTNFIGQSTDITTIEATANSQFYNITYPNSPVRVGVVTPIYDAFGNIENYGLITNGPSLFSQDPTQSFLTRHDVPYKWDAQGNPIEMRSEGIRVSDLGTPNAKWTVNYSIWKKN